MIKSAKMISAPRSVHVGVLVFPGCVRSAAVVPHDVLRVANLLMRARPAPERVRFETHWLGARRKSGVAVDGLSFETVGLDAHRLDALIVPGVDHDDAGGLTESIARLGPEQALLRAFAQDGGWLLSGCSGSCLVAQAGLLDGRRVTTSWWLADQFRRSFPAVRLQTDEILLQDGRRVSSAGVTSYFDLALWIVGEYGGADLRQIAAKMLVMDGRRASQAPYVTAAVLDGPGPVVLERARRWLDRRLDQAWTMAELAQHCHTSERTLLRRFQAVLGMGPVQYVQQARIERAKALLESTRLSLESITGRCGYQDVSTLSKMFKRWAGLTPREYRARFGLRS